MERRFNISTLLFDRCWVPYGDKPATPGMRVTCYKCGANTAKHINPRMTGRPDGDDHGLEMIVARKFTADGWKIGRERKHHRCPQCISRANQMAAFHAKQNDEKGKAMNVVNMPQTEAPLSFTVRRLIFAKLEETYADEKTGYKPNWTDQRVAEDLGVPVSWIKKVREENFGHATGNPDIERLIQEADKLRADAKAIAATAARLKDDFTKFAGASQAFITRYEMLDKRLHDTQQMLKR